MNLRKSMDLSELTQNMTQPVSQRLAIYMYLTMDFDGRIPPENTIQIKLKIDLNFFCETGPSCFHKTRTKLEISKLRLTIILKCPQTKNDRPIVLSEGYFEGGKAKIVYPGQN